MIILHLCKPEFETLLGREVATLGARVVRTGAGWVLAESAGAAPAEWLPADLCFASASLRNPQELTAPSVNAMAAKLAECFAGGMRGEKIVAEWPVVFEAGPGVDGLGGRATVLEKAWFTDMRGRMSRVLKLASTAPPPALQPCRGFYVYLTAFEQLFAACEFQSWGQRRMRDDPAAPSRSYLKVEEAYGILGAEPAAGETVADLGAAPGGWSYSAAKRGATVVAVDNGPLKAGAAAQTEASEKIEHRREDAFTFRPARGQTFDWLFCDIIDNPYRVLELVELWVNSGWCRRFVVNLKMGHHDPVALLGRVRQPQAGLAARCAPLRARHLHHDREEFTLVGVAQHTKV